MPDATEVTHSYRQKYVIDEAAWKQKSSKKLVSKRIWNLKPFVARPKFKCAYQLGEFFTLSYVIYGRE
jgi:hypothetical protein